MSLYTELRTRVIGAPLDPLSEDTRHNIALVAFFAWVGLGADPIDEVTRLAEQVHGEFPNCIFFASKLIFEDENWLIRLLHNQAALAIQRRLHLHGLQMVILPMKI
jgi:hypothetical protein